MKRKTGLIEQEMIKGDEYIESAEFKTSQLNTYTTPETIDQITNDPQRPSIAELAQKFNQRTVIKNKAKEAANQRPSIAELAIKAKELRDRLKEMKKNRSITPGYKD